MNGSTWRKVRAHFPLGALGVGIVAALLGALVMLLVPMAWIEEVSWQLYLDRLVAAARPPLGDTARLAAVLLGAGLLGLLGWALAAWLRVAPLPGGWQDWLARLRGQRPGDEADAPVLRASDRHPDAPARRPFSAVRDVVADGDAPSLRDDPASSWDDSDDELLLDGQFDAAADAPQLPEPTEAERAARWDALDRLDQADTPGDDQPVLSPVAAAAAVAPADEPTPAADPEPLDLSVARLDELIARLEAGLSRRQAQATAPMSAAAAPSPAVASPATPAPETTPALLQDDGDFPHDPALAAALATLRRMNRGN